MKNLEDYFAPAGQALYHYTGVGSLLKIVESNVIFATHAYYLNDSREITYASSRLREAAASRIESQTEEIERVFLKQFSSWLDSLKTPFNIFIFSLSEVPSLLSQWRSYTPHGKGVSLGFSPEILNRVVEENECRLAKCLYEPDEHQEVVSALVDKMLTSFRQKLPDLDVSRNHPPTCYHEFLEGFRGDLLQVLAVIKHPAFSEEREWRVITRYNARLSECKLSFREGGSMLIPYTKLAIPAQTKDKTLFDTVVMGPSQDQNLAMMSLGQFINVGNLCRHIRYSAIPYRQW